MKQKRKQFIAALLAAVMFVAVFPCMIFAEETEMEETQLLDMDFEKDTIGAKPATNNVGTAFNNYAVAEDPEVASITVQEDSKTKNKLAYFNITGKEAAQIVAYLYKPVGYDKAVYKFHIRTEDKNGKKVVNVRCTSGVYLELMKIEGGKIYLLGKEADNFRSKQWYDVEVELNFIGKRAALRIDGSDITEIDFDTNEDLSQTATQLRFEVSGGAGAPTTLQLDRVQVYGYSKPSEDIQTDPEVDNDLRSKIKLTDEDWQLVKDVLSASSGKHPSILFTEDQLPAFREKIKSGQSKKAFDRLSQNMENYMNISTEPYSFSVGAILGRVLQMQVGDLAFYSMMTGDDQYAKKAIAILTSVAEQGNLQTYQGLNDALAMGDMTHAFALGYDWLYHYMTEEERVLIGNELKELGNWLYTNSFTQFWGDDADVRRGVSNWNMVTHASLGLAAIALGGQEDWLGRALMRLHAYYTYSKDTTGESWEGLSYMGYGMQNAIPLDATIYHFTGTELIDRYPSMQSVPNYQMWQTVPWGGASLQINQANGNGNVSTVYYIINRYKDRVGLWGWEKICAFDGDKQYQPMYAGNGNQCPQIIIYEDQSLTPESPEEAGIGNFQYFQRGHIVAKDGWGDNDSLASFTCGVGNSGSWNHPDTASFIFMANGEEFVIDLGAGSVTTQDHNVPLVDGLGMNANGGPTVFEGQMLACEDFGTAVYAKGDATMPYSNIARLTKFNRQFVYGRGEIPYVFIFDDAEKDENEHEWTTNFYTAADNVIQLKDGANAARITGANNNSQCFAMFYSDGELEVGKLGDGPREKKAVTTKVKAVNPKMGALFIAPQTNGEMPRVVKTGDGSDFRLDLYLAAGRHDVIHVKDGELFYESYTPNDALVVVNGEISGKTQADYPVVADGTTYVTADWLNSYTDKKVRVLSDKRITVDGKEQSLQTPALEQEDKTLLPLRELCSLLDIKLDWIGETSSVSLTTGETAYDPLKSLASIAIEDWDKVKYPLSNLLVNGEQISGFSPKITEYTVTLPFGLKDIPQITAQSEYNTAVEPLTVAPGTAVIRVSANGDNEESIYKVNIKLETMQGIPDGWTTQAFAGVTESSGGAAENYDEYTVQDGDLATSWAWQNEAWLTADLGSVKTISAAAFAFLSGDQRKALFDIEVSTDGENFTKVFSGESCGTTADFETFSFTPVEARYVRYNGRGNSLSNWNNISEFRVLS